jgi:hypothetical protein
LNVFGCASWCYTTTDIYDANNLINGFIRYYLSEANVGNVTFPIRINSGGFSTPAATYYNLRTNPFNEILAPILTSTGSLPSCVAGTGVTACTVATGSTEARGTVTLTNSSATIGTPLVTIDFAHQVAGIPFCSVQQAGGAAWYGLFVGGSPTVNDFNVNNISSISGVTSLTFSYECQL